jgi:microcystin-dependent protein
MDMISVKATGSDLHVNGLNVVPAGSIICYSGQNVPQGWMFCNGQAISRTTFTKLFNTIGTLYGTGDGTSTFNLPNLQDRFPMGKGSSSLGVIGGANSVTLTSDKIPSHSHTATVSSDGAHSHTGSTNTTGSHNHSYDDAYFAENTGGGQNNVFGTSAGTDNDNSYRYRPNSGTGLSGDHSHTLTTNTEPSHTHTVTIENTGTSNPTIDITNKYITLNYIIRY